MFISVTWEITVAHISNPKYILSTSSQSKNVLKSENYCIYFILAPKTLKVYYYYAIVQFIFTHNTMKNLFIMEIQAFFATSFQCKEKYRGIWVQHQQNGFLLIPRGGFGVSSSRFFVFAKKGFSNTRNRLVPEEHLRTLDCRSTNSAFHSML